jgi:hypothetical protein
LQGELYFFYVIVAPDLSSNFPKFLSIKFLSAVNAVTITSCAVGRPVAAWLSTSLAATEVPVAFIQEIQHEANLVFPSVGR